MNHLKWMGHTDTLLDINRSLRDEAESCEVTLVARGGATVRAHRFVLCTCSELLRCVLKDVPLESESTVMLPDISSSLLDSLLSFIYMGETSLSSTSLSEFLEAINLLGIKSAISFECQSNLNTSSPINNLAVGSGVGNNNSTIPIKAINGLQITQEEFVEEVEAVEKIVESNSAVTDSQLTTTRGLEYLDVYSEQAKITYSIEHMTASGGGGEFILTENANTYTITAPTQEVNDKLSNTAATVVDTSDLVEDETEVVDEEEVEDDGNLIEEEYNSGGEPLLEMSTTDVEMSDPVELQQGQLDSSGEADAQMLEAARASIKLRTIKAKRQIAEHKLAMSQGVGMTAKASKSKAKNPIEMDNLEMAAQAVLQEGLSLQKAADKYDLSKTVLWRRMRKDPTYQKIGRVKPELSLAFERLKNGDSLKNISKDLEIPMSTLHRHKVRLSEEGRLPQFVTCRRRDATPKEELQLKLAKAVHACVHDGMSQNHAANVYEIPKSTLWRHLRRRVAEAEQALDSENIKEEEVILS